MMRLENGEKEKPPGSGLFSQGVAPSVSSALKRFTSVFGMGTGGSTPLKPPEGKRDYSTTALRSSTLLEIKG
jgi:hypothetical protein